MSVRTYKQYKEKAIFDISSDEIQSYETKNYSGSLDTTKFYDVSLYSSFHNTIDNVSAPIVRYNFTNPANDTQAINNIGTGGTTYDGTIHSANIIQQNGQQTVGQYIWPTAAVIGTDYIKLPATSVDNLDTSGFTISFWADAGAISNKNYLFYVGTNGQTDSYTKAFISILFPWDGAIYFICGDGTNALALTNGRSRAPTSLMERLPIGHLLERITVPLK